MKQPITKLFHSLGNIMTKMSADEPVLDAPSEDLGLGTDPATDPAAAEPAPVEEKDQDTKMQEHVTNFKDKYRLAFEGLFPKAQMVARNVEYHGATMKDKVRVMVEFETPMLNFDALQIMSAKEIGLEATGENTFKVYNIYLPMVKDPSLK